MWPHKHTLLCGQMARSKYVKLQVLELLCWHLAYLHFATAALHFTLQLLDSCRLSSGRG
jgi:hypothetical protein